MSNPFTLRRWSTNQWQMYLLGFAAWASVWQIIDAPDAGSTGIAIANLVGCLVALLALHLRDSHLMRSVERWAYVMLIWSMSCYLSLALQYEGLDGLWRQPNLGVVAAEAIICAALHRTIYTLVIGRIRRRKIRREAQRMLTQCQSNPSAHSDGNASPEPA
jgi:hypothetical protein